VENSLTKAGIVSGILAPVIWLSLIVVAGAMRPEFSHATQFISELAETGGSTELMMRYAAFCLSGILYLFFAITLAAIFRGDKFAALSAVLVGLDGLGRIGAGLFPCDPGCEGISSTQELHRLFATVGFLAGVSGSIAWGITLRRYNLLRKYSLYSVVSGSLALLFLLLMSWGENPMPAPGLFEHLATGILSLWVLVFAIVMIGVAENKDRNKR